jgi:acyl-coenzyme A thioesterase PaaI-like protein
MRLKDLKTPDPTAHFSGNEADGVRANQDLSPEVLCLMSLGPGLEAHPSIVHGGFQAVIFDEVMRLLVLVHENNICGPELRSTHFTVNMNVSYLAPVLIPGNVLVRSQLLGRQGRKWFTKADIVDGVGKVLTSAHSVWVTAKKAP